MFKYKCVESKYNKQIVAVKVNTNYSQKLSKPNNPVVV